MDSRALVRPETRMWIGRAATSASSSLRTSCICAVFHLGPLNLIGVRPEPGHRLGQPALFERRQVFGHGLCGPR